MIDIEECRHEEGMIEQTAIRVIGILERREEAKRKKHEEQEEKEK